MENNGWIKCTDKLPTLKTRTDLLRRSDVLLVWGKQEKDDTNHIFAAYMIGGNRFYSPEGECYKVTHWRELPEPPID